MVVGNAVISDDGRYRYELWRNLQRDLFKPDRGTLVVCMLNPSTADATVDDPTISRLVGRATDEGFAHLAVVNLFAVRATDPRELLSAEDPVGPDNDEAIRRVVAQATRVLVAWGNGPDGFRDRMQARVDEVLPMLGTRAWCLGTTESGAPRHPLYLAKSLSMLRYEPGGCAHP